MLGKETNKSTDTSAKNRLEWLDIAKGIAIFLVVVGHTVDKGTARHLIFSFHMPLFFILAGFTLRAKPWKVVVKSSAKRLLLPYVLVVAVQLLPSFLTSTVPLSSRFLALVQVLVFPAGYPSTRWMPHDMWAGVRLDYIEGGLWGVGMPWFLWCLFLARIIANGLLRIAARRKVDNNPWVLAVVSIAMISAGLAMSQGPQYFWPFDFDLAVLAGGFMLFGYLIKVLDLVRPKLALAGVAAFIVWVIATKYSAFEMACRDWGEDNYELAVCGALAGTYALCYLSLGIEALRTVPILKYGEKAVAWAGRHSMEIYVMHAIDYKFLNLGNISIGVIANNTLVKSLVRFGYDLFLVALVRKISR